ncbi:two-component regulator propeller domain-containing protein [Candidatus Villigracilis affinis]|uniref:sensor histidine kinase n=1 Tax=Candidatus Villigracilis affinis TaxID=3140682 RepID=UPI002A1FFF99|nr:PAS domain S-box protein [Anaerolineales bacterium]
MSSTTGLAAPPTGAAFDADLNFAPGSVVRFEHLTIEDGLSQNAGLAIFQDSRGYLWIGTQDGLNRYDGYGFKIYKHDPDDPNSLSHNSILSMGEDKNGSLWIGTWGGGLNRYDPATETFTRYLTDPEAPASLSDGTIYSIKSDSNGDLWIATLAGLDRYNPETNTFEHFKNDPNNPNSLSSDAVSYIFEDSNHQLWIGTGAGGVEGSGLNRFDPSSGTFTRYQHDESDPESLASNNIASIVEAPDGTLWIATGGFSLHGSGLDNFDPQTGKVKHFTHDPQNEHSLSGDDVMSLWLDPDGALWIGTWANGLSRMNLADPGYFTRYQNDPYFPDSLSGDEVWSLFRDRSGILWVGTSHSGINKLPANAGQFSLYRNNPGNPASLGANTVGAFAEDKRGNIWVATWGGGLDRFDPDTGTFAHYHHDPENPNSLSDDLFMDVYVDPYNTVWAGTLGKGLNRLNSNTDRVTHYLHEPENPASLADDNIATFLPDKKGNLWVGTFGGLSRFDPNADSFTNYSNDSADPTSLSSNTVVSLYIDSNNILWIGTWGGGLNQLDLNDPRQTDPKTATFTRYIHNADNTNSLSEDSVWTIHETTDGFIWLGTQLGLNRLDPRTGEFKHYTEKNGLPNNVVLGILEDNDGNLWLTTNNGLAEFDRRTETFTHYDTSDGLQSNEFNSNAYFQSADGTMYVGGINGFNLFRPEDIKPNPVAPQVVVTRFDVFNEPQLVDLTGRTPIELSYQQDFISFEFSAFDFQAPQKNQYAYKLEGFDEDWIQAGNRRYATYTNLTGGDYTFHVKASNSDSVWNEQGISIPIVITPPYWQTWWFNGSLIVVLSVLLAGGFKWRLDAIREQNIHLETQVSERTSELREMNKLLETEVEQRKRAEEALAKHAAEELYNSQARFQAIFDNVAVGVAVMSLERRPITFNAATERIIGYNAEDLRNVDPRLLAVPEDRGMDVDLFKDLIEGKRDSYVMERRYRHKDSRIFWARVNYSLVRDLNGKPDYLVGIIEDIDEQKRASERMAEQEADYLLNLQQRVQERTHELEDANQRLQKEIEQRTKIEKELAEKAAEEAVTADRTRLARDLHDAVTQTLFSASLTAEVLPELWEMDVDEAVRSTEELRQLTRGALAEMRTLLLELRPAALTQTRLSDLIKQLCEAFIGRSRLPITLSIEGDCKLPPEVQVAVYRIAQESLNNIFKYARATQVNVSLSLFPDGLHFEICDNGIGFDMSTSKPTSLGLRIMRERAEAIGADYHISSTPGSGTCVEVIWNANPNIKLRVL